jgi:pyruvate kinase
MERQTKIVATLGPAVDSPEAIRSLIRAGMDVARLNFSHGDHDFHRRMTEWVRTAADEEDRVVAVLQDIQGPKLRVGRLARDPTILSAGQEVTLIAGDSGSGDEIPVAHPLDEVRPGERILLADGLIRLRVVESDPTRVVARVEQGGALSSGKGVALPDTELRVPAVTDKDREDLELGRELEVDYVAASFVRSGEDVRQVRELAGGTPVVAKIELASAYANLDDILDEAAGVMVARGDLGVQLPLERIPLVQADILYRANRAGVITITATEMLESMTHSPRPTRAEVTDVATAVMSGTDAVMLSGETAVGEYPIEATETMARICTTVEAGWRPSELTPFIATPDSVASAVAQAAVEAAANLGVETIVAFTESGNTARLISKYRPAARIIAFTPVARTLTRMALYRGVRPYPFERRDYTDMMIAAAEKFLEKSGICRRGETVVMVAGIPPNQKASTNLMKVHVVGERDRGVASQRTGRTSPEVGGFSRGTI